MGMGFTSYAQVFQTNNSHMDELFKVDVTTMSEFRERFNQSIESTGGDNLPQLLSLFDRNSETILSKQDLVRSFADDVLKSRKMIAFSDTSWFAEALCVIKYQGKQHDIQLILKTEQVDGAIYRWAIVGANGLKEAGIIKDAEFGYIEPIDNELNFIDLDNRLQKDYKNAFGYQSADTSTNQLSILLYLIQEHLLTIEFFDKIRYHFLTVPGYVFIVEQSNTPMNSGWLISDISTITQDGKELYKKALCGNY